MNYKNQIIRNIFKNLKKNVEQTQKLVKDVGIENNVFQLSHRIKNIHRSKLYQ